MDYYERRPCTESEWIESRLVAQWRRGRRCGSRVGQNRGRAFRRLRALWKEVVAAQRLSGMSPNALWIRMRRCNADGLDAHRRVDEGGSVAVGRLAGRPRERETGLTG